MNRILICSSERDECEFLKEELEDFGKVVKIVESLDFLFLSGNPPVQLTRLFLQSIL